MVPRHPADESRGYYYGIVTRHGKVIWDEPIPYMSRVTDTLPAILANKHAIPTN